MYARIRKARLIAVESFYLAGLGDAVASIHQVAEKGASRRLGFRCREFSETQSVPLLILENPICGGNPIHNGPGLCTNS